MSDWVPVAVAAKRIRDALKAKGWGRRHVSVRAKSYSMGSSISVTILDVSVPRAEVETVANGEEHVDRDEQGEILSGGNRFVFVDYDRAALEPLVSRVDAQLAGVEATGRAVLTLGGYVARKLSPGDLGPDTWVASPVGAASGRHSIHCHGREFAAAQIVRNAAFLGTVRS